MTKPLKNFVWTSDFAYAIGLLATDGNVSTDRRHIHFTSKDKVQVETLRTILCKDNPIARKARGGEIEKKYFILQFGDVQFCRFLISIGIHPNKSKTISIVKIPKKYFFDFLRGCVDGDGNIHTFMHPESSQPQLRVRITSASRSFLDWINAQTQKHGIKGFIVRQRSCFVLHYAKRSSIDLLNHLYYPGFRYCLERKYQKAKPFMALV